MARHNTDFKGSSDDLGSLTPESSKIAPNQAKSAKKGVLYSDPMDRMNKRHDKELGADEYLARLNPVRYLKKWLNRRRRERGM